MMHRRLNLGCGSVVVDGWENLDLELHDGATQGDVRGVLPYDDEVFDYVVANHSLSDLTHHELVPALREIRRLLRPGGVLRILVPDLIGALRAWERQDAGWFPLGDDLPSIDERLCTFVPWFGTVGSVWTQGYATELLRAAGYRTATVCRHGRTVLCDTPEIADLDDRETQALRIEARR